MRVKLFLIFVLCVCISSFGQQSLIDSLTNRLLLETDKQKIETYIELSNTNISNRESLTYLLEGLELARQIEYNKLYTLYRRISIEYYLLADIELAIQYIDSADMYLKYTADSIDFAALNMSARGVYYEANNEIDSARYFYNIGFKLIENENTENSKLTRATLNTNLANLYLKKSQYDEAIPLYLKSAEIASKFGDSEGEMISLINASSCFKEMGDFDNALFYLEKARPLNVNMDIIYYDSMMNTISGEISFAIGDTINGIRMLENSISIIEKNEYNIGLSTVYLALAEVYEKQNNSRAFVMSKKAMSMVNEIDNPFDRVGILINYAKLKLKTGNYKVALTSLEESKIISFENEYLELYAEALMLEIEIFKHQDKKSNLILAYEDYIKVLDSLASYEKSQIIEEANVKYQTSEKEKENLLLRNENARKEISLQNETIRKQRNGIFAVTTFAAFILFFIYARNRRKKLQDANKLRIVETKQLEHQKIGRDLHDSKAKVLEDIELDLLAKGEKQIAKRVRKVKNHIRVLSHELQQLPFYEEEFDSQLLTLLYGLHRDGIKVYHEGIKTIEWQAIDDTIKRNLYLVINEAASNIRIHAGATESKFVFKKQEKKF